MFYTGDRTGSVPEAKAGPEHDELKQAVEDLRSLVEFNAYVHAKEVAMSTLKSELHILMASSTRSQVEIDQKCKEIENLTVMNLEAFNIAKELRHWQNWQEDPSNLRSAMWGRVAIKIDLLQQALKDRQRENARRTPTISSDEMAVQLAEIEETKKTMKAMGYGTIKIEEEINKITERHAKDNSTRVPFQYEDVLISVHFDGFEGAGDYVATCTFPKKCHISHVIAWLRHRVLDMGALVPAGDSELPFTLHRLVLLDPDMTVGIVCSAPTSKVTCRVNLTESARGSGRPPFQVEPRVGDKKLDAAVKDLFPKLIQTDHEIGRIQKLKVDTERKKRHAIFFGNDLPFKRADVANRPVRWKFSAPDGRVVEGNSTCDELRLFLNRGHFDDASKFGALLNSYTFSFDGSSYVCFGTHLEMLRHINHQALNRSLNAVRLTLQASAAAAAMTWPDTYNDFNAALASDSEEIREGENGEQGCLSFKLPLLPGKDPVMLKKIFTDKMASVDRERASKTPQLSPLFCKEAISCNVEVASDSHHLDVEFLFSSFLSLDCILRQKAGLQIVLESMMFDFYFEQTKRSEFTDLTEKWKCPICNPTPPTTGATAPTGPTGETGPARPSPYL